MMGDRCRIHCPAASSDAVVAAVAAAAAAAGLVLAVVAAVGPLLIAVMSVLCVVGVVLFAALMRRGGVMWRPARQPSRRVRVALEEAAAREALAAAERPAIATASAAEFLAQLPVYAVITDAREARGR